jgi:hypothetical protein
MTDASERYRNRDHIITVGCVECGRTLEVAESRAGDPRPITCGGCPTIEPIQERDRGESA